MKIWKISRGWNSPISWGVICQSCKIKMVIKFSLYHLWYVCGLLLFLKLFCMSCKQATCHLARFDMTTVADKTHCKYVLTLTMTKILELAWLHIKSRNEGEFVLSGTNWGEEVDARVENISVIKYSYLNWGSLHQVPVCLELTQRLRVSRHTLVSICCLRPINNDCKNNLVDK